MAEMKDLKVGMIVSFGRRRGEQTRARIIRINYKKVQVETLEARGRQRKGPGQIWNDLPSLITVLKDSDLPKGSVPLTRKPVLPVLPPKPAFRVGQKVTLTHRGEKIEGTITRVNRKTVSVVPTGWGEYDGYIRASFGLVTPA